MRSSVNGRIMLTGEAADAVTLDKAVTIARQFGPEIINSVAVMSPQQVLLEVRFIEISRTAGRELGVQWNRFGGQSVVNIGNNVPAGALPIAHATGVALPASSPAPIRSALQSANLSTGSISPPTSRSTRSSRRVLPAALLSRI